jgi:hypothetical protein
MGKSVMGNAVNAESRFLRTEEHETEALLASLDLTPKKLPIPKCHAMLLPLRCAQ